uniref:Uncharacterized protein n=1 Tax=Anguilla anguilla TaxID=7936 RepID=A0A0E9UFQ7_ANGAN
MRCEAESDAEAEINIDDTDGVRRVAVRPKIQRLRQKTRKKK